MPEAEGQYYGTSRNANKAETDTQTAEMHTQQQGEMLCITAAEVQTLIPHEIAGFNANNNGRTYYKV